MGWEFDITKSGDGEHRFRATAVSDLYRALQSRLDGYRQAAGAIFVGTIAAALTFDSLFLRSLLEPAQEQTGDATQGVVPFATTAFASIILITMMFAAARLLYNIRKHFGEMSSIVQTIEEQHGFFEEGTYVDGRSLLPPHFRSNRNVSTDSTVRYGWYDFATSTFMYTSSGLAVIHLLGYGYLLARSWPW